MVECQVFALKTNMLALDKLNFLIYLHQTLFGMQLQVGLGSFSKLY